MAIEFFVTGANEAGEALYTLRDNGEIKKEGMTIDKVIELLNERDEKSLGARHAPKAI